MCFCYLCFCFLRQLWRAGKSQILNHLFRANLFFKRVRNARLRYHQQYRYPNEYANLGSAAPVYAVSISGSLKENIERIMRRYNWKVVWKAPYDYNFDGKVTGSSLPNVMQKLLQPFPLQAVMYMSNRTIAVVPRQLR